MMDEEFAAQAKEIFNNFDKNGDGSIEASELRTVLEQFDIEPTDQLIEAMIKEADENNDGKIDFAEFMRLLKAFLEEQDDD